MSRSADVPPRAVMRPPGNIDGESKRPRGLNDDVHRAVTSGTSQALRARLRHTLGVDLNSFGVRMGSAQWFPVLNLVWLFWMVGAPWFLNRTDTRTIALTFVSLPVFLVLYFRSWYGDRRRIVWNTSAIAILGLAMVVANTSFSYIIYAAVLVPYCARPGRALLWLALLLGAFYVVAMQNGFSTTLTLSAISMCAGISLINAFGKASRERDAELRLSHEEVRRLAATAERERIGRDLHDLLGHTLSLIAIKSELADKLFERDPTAARNELREVNRVARDSLAQVRSAVTGIRAAGLAAETASAKLLLESSGVQLHAEIDDVSMAAPIEHALALCLREAVTNIHRHANASHASIRITRRGNGIELRIADDGRGGIARDGNGLAGIRERVAGLHGRLQLDSPRGKGTTLVIRVEISPALSTTEEPAIMPKLDRLAAGAC